MTLSLPDFLTRHALAESKAHFDWQGSEQAEVEVPQLYNNFSCLYSRCELGLAIALTEWIYWRLSKDLTDTIFLQFIEASWAAVVDRRYLKYKSSICYYSEEFYQLSHDPYLSFENFADDDYCDSKLGPMLVALTWLGKAIDRTTPKGSCTQQAVYLSNLVRQVVGKSKARAFTTWRRSVLGRFDDFYLLKEADDNFLGPPVPREAFYLDTAFSSEIAGAHLQRFLGELDHATNPFLASPQELIALGFKGSPYSYGGPT